MSNAESVDHNAIDGDDPDAFPRPFGQYLLLENFARGGMGEVYLAKIGGIAGLERYCVLKKLRSELTRDREYVTRFIDEARVVVTLNHANICHVFDVGRVGEEYYLAMEYISGRDVRTAQDRTRTKERNFPPATALHLVCETLEALDYAHRRNHPLTGEPLNLVHRDVSPQNVLVSFEGEVKLIDFGLAASRLKVERTQPNVVMGKMAYMAPEQARGDPIDARADLFACGVLAYELLSGERFYEGMTANDIWQVAGKGGFSPRKWSAIDPELQRHLGKALHPDPKRRYATCGDFREALASHMHWKFPGTGVRGLREVMKELFADEIRKENELLARFGKVTVAGFRTEFEESRSTSVSLARADDDASSAHHAASGARLVRNEQSSSAPLGSMPPPMRDQSREGASQGTRDTVIRDRSVSGEGRGDVHREATRLVGARDVDGTAEGTDAIPKDRSTDEQTGSVTTSGSGSPRRDLTAPAVEPTQRVNRRKGVHEAGTELVVRPVTLPDDDDITAPPTGRRWTLVLAASGAVIALVALAWVLTRPPAPKNDVTANNANVELVNKTDKTNRTEVASVVDKAAEAEAKAAEEKRLADEKARADAQAKQAEEDKRAEEKRIADEKKAEEERVAALSAARSESKKERAERKKHEKDQKDREAREKAEREAREKADRAPPVERVTDKPRESRKTVVSAMRENEIVKVCQLCAPCRPLVVGYTMGTVPLNDLKGSLVASTECTLPSTK